MTALRVSCTSAALVAALCVCACHRAANAAEAWHDVAPGVRHRAFTEAASTTFHGHVFTIDLAHNRLLLVPASGEKGRSYVDDVAAGYRQHIAINASFFDDNNHAMGRQVSQGNALSLDRRETWGAFVVDATGAHVTVGSALPVDKAGGDVVVQGIPRLVVDGAVQKLKPMAAPRTAICGEGNIVVIVVANDDAETTDFAAFLARPEKRGGAGCTNALNLDGGPSTQLSARWGAFHAVVDGGWGVPNALVVVPR